MENNHEIFTSERVLELLTLLLGDGSSSDDDDDDGSAMRRWFTEKNEQLKSATTDSLVLSTGNGLIQTVPKLLILLRECMLSQRWPEVSHVVRILALEHYNTSCSIWKTGTQQMMVDEANSALLEQVIAPMKRLGHLNEKEVVLDYIKYLIVHGRTNDARNTSKMFRYVPRVSDRAEISEGIDDQYKVYQGLLAYIEWLTEKKKGEQMEQDIDDDPFLFQSSVFSHESSMKSFADRALVEFSSIQDKPGVWDIFITKQVELLEYYGRADEAYIILCRYRDKNPDNPNTHRYLYQFSKKHDYAETVQLLALKEYVKLIPSDPLVLDLCDRLQKTDDCNYGDILAYLITALDYAEWSNNPVIWEQTFHTAKHCARKSESIAVLKSLWHERQDWWPEYHFSQLHSTSEIMIYKLAVAVVFMGPETVSIPEHYSTTAELIQAKKLHDRISDIT